MYISVTVRNTCNQAIDGTVGFTVAVNRAKPGGPPRSGRGSTRFEVPDSDSGFELTLTAKAAGYYDAVAQVSFDGKAWLIDSGNVRIDSSKNPVTIDILVGRIRFAPTVQADENKTVRSPYNPGAVLLEHHPPDPPIYAAAQYHSVANFRTLETPVVGNLDITVPVPGTKITPWDRFKYKDTRVPNKLDLDMTKCGVWINLEYGDPPGTGNDIRQLVGVWAPFRTTAVPIVIVQITPNTSFAAYPSDGLPLTGIYPYGCVGPSSGELKNFGKNFGQSYPGLPLTRTLTGYAIGYQLYAARNDLFGIDNGPIVITVSPAHLKDGSVLREPINCREGLGRLIAEVLCFLWANRIATSRGKGGGSLVFRGGMTSFMPAEGGSAEPEDAMPPSCKTTVIEHSAAVVATYQTATTRTWSDLAQPTSSARNRPLVSSKPIASLFPQALYGGPTSYGDANWRGLWLIDGVVSYPPIDPKYMPSAGSPATRAWLAWQAEQPAERSVVAVYTEAGLPGSMQNGLVRGVVRQSGKAGWVEEKRDGRLAWLRFSNSCLLSPYSKAEEETAIARGQKPPILDTHDAHNFIYTLGAGYAAKVFR